MTFDSLAKPSVRTQPIYEPGKPIDDVARELGLDPAGIIKLASNENPWGPSPKAIAAAKRALEHGELYPDGGCFALRQKLAVKWGLGADQFVVGNGSNEIIELLGHAFVAEGDEVVMGAPAFVVYKLVTLLFGAKAVEVPLVNHRHDLAKIAAAITPPSMVLAKTKETPTPITPAMVTPLSSATRISRAIARAVFDWVSWLVASARTVTASVCVPALPPTPATIGMSVASATIFWIVPSNAAMIEEASIAVNRFATSQRTRLL